MMPSIDALSCAVVTYDLLSHFATADASLISSCAVRDGISQWIHVRRQRRRQLSTGCDEGLLSFDQCDSLKGADLAQCSHC